MNKKFSLLLPLVGLLFAFTTGASQPNKDSKSQMGGLDEKMEMVKRQESGHHAELMKILKEEREQVQILMQRIDSLQRQTSPTLNTAAATEEPPAAAPAPTPTPTTASATTAEPAAANNASSAPSTTAVATTAATPSASEDVKSAEHAKTPEPVKTPEPAPTVTVVSAPALTPIVSEEKVLPKPSEVVPKRVEITPPPELAKTPDPTPAAVAASNAPAAKITTNPLPAVVPAVVPPKPTAPVAPIPTPAAAHTGASTNDILSRMSLFVAVFSIILMVVILIRMKRGEDHIRKLIWKAEMGALREELSQVRSPKPANPKIQVTGNLPKVNVS